MALAVLLVGHRLAIGGIGLHVVERRHRPRGVAERRVARDVVDALAADIDDAAVAQRSRCSFPVRSMRLRRCLSWLLRAPRNDVHSVRS